MSKAQKVIHKVVYSITAEVMEQTFSIPEGAEIVGVDWDTRDPFGVAIWYAFTPPPTFPHSLGPMKEWKVTIRGTGYAYPSDFIHLKTLVKDGYAWHLFDTPETHLRWSWR